MDIRTDSSWRTIVSLNESWEVFSFPQVPHLIFVGIEGSTWALEKVCPGFGFDALIVLWDRKGDESEWIMPKGFVKRQYQRILSDRKILVQMYEKWEASLQVFFDYADRLEENGIRDLRTDYEAFYHFYVTEYAPALILEYFYDGTEYLLQRIIEKYPKLKNEIQAAVGPSRPTFVAEESADLLRLAIDFKQKHVDSLSALKNANPKLFEKLVKHQKKFFWIQNNYKYTDPISLEIFFETLQREAQKTSEQLHNEISKFDSYVPRMKQLREQLTQKTDPQTAEDIELLAKIGFWHDSRKKGALIGSHYLNEFLKKASALHQVPLEILQATTVPEFLDFLKTGVLDQQRIMNRVEKGAMVADKTGKFFILTGKELDALSKQVHPTVLVESIQVFEGLGVSPGKVEGICRIVQKPSDAFNPGEILVSSMTRPELVPLMKKAAGVVTDEGGITSHAAVISREFGIPCVVGTRRATKILKNGMKIQLDANHGAIRILSNETEE